LIFNSYIFLYGEDVLYFGSLSSEIKKVTKYIAIQCKRNPLKN